MPPCGGYFTTTTVSLWNTEINLGLFYLSALVLSFPGHMPACLSPHCQSWAKSHLLVTRRIGGFPPGNSCPRLTRRSLQERRQSWKLLYSSDVHVSPLAVTPGGKGEHWYLAWCQLLVTSPQETRVSIGPMTAVTWQKLAKSTRNSKGITLSIRSQITSKCLARLTELGWSLLPCKAFLESSPPNFLLGLNRLDHS